MSDVLIALLVLLYWGIIITALLTIVRYIYLVFKRCILVIKLKSTLGECANFNKFSALSVFVPSAKVQCRVKKGKTIYELAFLTTPFKKVRYHFADSTHLEIIKERRKVALISYRSHTAPTASYTEVSTIAKFKIKPFERTVENSNAYIILHPAPYDISAVNGTKTILLSDNNVLYDGVRICSLSYFLKKVK